MILHVMPIDDWIEHEESTTCICRPTVELVDGNMLVVHYAADGREAEPGRELRTKQDET